MTTPLSFEDHLSLGKGLSVFATRPVVANALLMSEPALIAFGASRDCELRKVCHSIALTSVKLSPIDRD